MALFVATQALNFWSPFAQLLFYHTHLYLVDSGCKWRQLPHDFPPYSTVHSFYRRARLSGLWDGIMKRMVLVTRKNAGRNEDPTYAIFDSQSVQTDGPGEERGYDGEKNAIS